MKKLTLSFVCLSCVNLTACNITPSSEHNALQGLAQHSVKSYINENNGCSQVEHSKLIKLLPAKGDADEALTPSTQHREHWRVNACGKTHELELSIDQTLNKVSIQTM